jgi:hypothetical protein
MLRSASAIRLLLIVAVLVAIAAVAGELPWGPV